MNKKLLLLFLLIANSSVAQRMGRLHPSDYGGDGNGGVDVLGLLLCSGIVAWFVKDHFDYSSKDVMSGKGCAIFAVAFILAFILFAMMIRGCS